MLTFVKCAHNCTTFTDAGSKRWNSIIHKLICNSNDPAKADRLIHLQIGEMIQTCRHLLLLGLSGRTQGITSCRTFCKAVVLAWMCRYWRRVERRDDAGWMRVWSGWVGSSRIVKQITDQAYKCLFISVIAEWFSHMLPTFENGLRNKFEMQWNIIKCKLQVSEEEK